MDTAKHLDRRTVIALALLMPLGPALVAALRAVLPTFSSDSAKDITAAVASAPAQQSAVVWLGYAAVLVLVPGVLAVARMTRAAAPRLTWWALATLVPAYLSLGTLTAVDGLSWSANDAGLGAGTATALYNHQHPAFVVGLVVFVVGHVVGTVLLGLALLKSRRVHPAFGWGLTLSQPAHFIAYVILGVQALDVLAWAVTTICMAAAAVALLRDDLPVLETSAPRVREAVAS